MKWNRIDQEQPIDNKDALFLCLAGEMVIGYKRTDEDDNILYISDRSLTRIENILWWIYLDDIPKPSADGIITNDKWVDLVIKGEQLK